MKYGTKFTETNLSLFVKINFYKAGVELRFFAETVIILRVFLKLYDFITVTIKLYLMGGVQSLSYAFHLIRLILSKDFNISSKLLSK